MSVRTLTGVLALLSAVTSTHAADFNPFQPVIEPAAPAAPPSGWTWTSLYAGGHLGTGFATTRYSNPIGQAAGTGSLFGDVVKVPAGVVGLQAGANWQLPNSNWVVGIEGALSLLDGRGSNTCLTANAVIVSANCSLREHSTGSLTGRVGAALGPDNRMLLYAKGGVGFLSQTSTEMLNYDGFVPAQTVRSKTQGAFVIGGGLEYAVTSDFSLKLDYEHFGLGSFSQPTTYFVNGTRATMRGTPTFDIVRLGANYHFGTNGVPAWNDMPTAGPSLASVLQFEFGARYWYSVGKFQKDLAAGSSNSTSLVSRLTYQDKANSAELFAKISGDNAYLRGSVADGRLSTGKLNDEDWLGTSQGPSIPYSNTLSTAKGSPSSAIFDFGYDVLHSGGNTLSAFVGYTYLYEQHKGYGCVQQTTNSAICSPGQVATGTLAITETDMWNGLRLGLSGDVQLYDRLRLSVDAAYLPFVTFTGTDNHWLRNLVIKENGHGQGTQLQGVLTYDITPNFSVGVGARYWAFWVDDGTDKFSGASTNRTVSYKTERAGAFLQGSYKFASQ